MKSDVVCYKHFIGENALGGATIAYTLDLDNDVVRCGFSLCKRNDKNPEKSDRYSRSLGRKLAESNLNARKGNYIEVTSEEVFRDYLDFVNISFFSIFHLNANIKDLSVTFPKESKNLLLVSKSYLECVLSYEITKNIPFATKNFINSKRIENADYNLDFLFSEGQYGK